MENQKKSSFTGYKRARKTRKSVHIANTAAKSIITVSGLLTILSVLLVCFFLIWVALPLFIPASAESENLTSSTSILKNGELIRTVADEYFTVNYMIKKDGSISLYFMEDGSLIKQDSLFPGKTITASAFAYDGTDCVFGFADGTMALGNIEFDVSFMDMAEIEISLKDLEVDKSRVFQEGVVTRINESQFRYQTVAFEFAEPVAVAPGHEITSMDISNAPSGVIVGSLSGDRILRVSKIRTRTNMLTGEETISLTSGEYDLNSQDQIKHVNWLRLDAWGNSIYLIEKDGDMARINCQDVDDINLAEFVDLLPGDEERTITSTEFVLGKNTLLVGDSLGKTTGWFGTKPEGAKTSDGIVYQKTHELTQGTGTVTAIAVSHRSRKTVVGYSDGSIRIFLVTTDTQLAQGKISDKNEAVQGLFLSVKDDRILANSNSENAIWRINTEHPETTLYSMFMPIWYEGYNQPEHVWQTSSASDDFEPKYGMIPLVFGTLKATFYSLLFGVPIALLAAIYTSQFLDPKRKAIIKPTIEMMASIPSVVLGFLAGLVFAPYIEDYVPEMLTLIYVVPVFILLGAFIWQMIPNRYVVKMSRFRLGGVLVMIPIGIWCSISLGPLVEDWLFAGNIMEWLNGQIGRGTGGWMLLLIPLSGMAIAFLVSTILSPWLKKLTANMNNRQYALVDLAKFVVAVIATIALAYAVSELLTIMGMDPRGGFVDTYIQRNALIVGFVMGFAIIPIIYTIAEDALSAVPEHLKAGSLAAGATPWQTAFRIIIPTSVSGLFSSIMIGLGRAVGETMIVLMAAGNTPILEWNIFNGFRTLAANIAVELPEAVQNSTHYRSLFFAALLLFLMTFIVNTLAEIVRQRFRKRSSQL